jgi:hypothetical protein
LPDILQVQGCNGVIADQHYLSATYVSCQEFRIIEQLLPDVYRIAATAKVNCQGFHVPFITLMGWLFEHIQE